MHPPPVFSLYVRRTNSAPLVGFLFNYARANALKARYPYNGALCSMPRANDGRQRLKYTFYNLLKRVSRRAIAWRLSPPLRELPRSIYGNVLCCGGGGGEKKTAIYYRRFHVAKPPVIHAEYSRPEWRTGASLSPTRSFWKTKSRYSSQLRGRT